MDEEALEFVIGRIHEHAEAEYELIKDVDPVSIPEGMTREDVAFHAGKREAYLVALNYVSGLWDGEYDRRP